MAQVNTQLGTAVNIAFGGTVGGLQISSPAISTKLILQSTDEAQDADNVRVHNEVGDVIQSAWMDQHTKATLEFIISGTGLADAINSTALMEMIVPGELLTISACQQQPGLVATNWEVMSGPKVAGTNRDAKKFSVNVEKRAGITQVTPA